MIVRTFDGLQALTTPTPSWRYEAGGSISLFDRRQACAEIFRSQPNVRICVEFLARNIAELALHVFRRVSDTDRVRLAEHQLAQWMDEPNPSTTGYRLIEGLIGDLGIYFEAYWLKVRYRDSANQDQIGLVRLPPEEMRVEGGLFPKTFIWTVDGREKEFAPSEIVYFNGYNPLHPFRGLSPMETLRRILAEEEAAGEHREAFWRNASRHEGVIERTADSPSGKWTNAQDREWKEQWGERYAGRGASGAGSLALLKAGMVFKPTSFSAKDSEFVAGGKLRREVCAAAYHIPQPMVGILDHATFSNIKEQHKHLYQDTLGPWLKMIVQEIRRQVLTECADQRAIYIEFNIAAKLAGTPEEQIDTLVRATGKPIMRVNEARARLNLPRDDDPASDKIAAQQGGPSDATANPSSPVRPPADADGDDDEDETERAVAPIIEATRDRQQARLAKLPATDRPAAFTGDLDRWNRELAADLRECTGKDEAARATAVNAELLRQLEADAIQARVVALERRPPDPPPAPAPPQTINVHLAVTPEEREKRVVLEKDAAGAVTGGVVSYGRK